MIGKHNEGGKNILGSRNMNRIGLFSGNSVLVGKFLKITENQCLAQTEVQSIGNLIKRDSAIFDQ